MSNVFNFTYRKVGGLRFVKIGRLGFSFWLSRTNAECAVGYYRNHRGET